MFLRRKAIQHTLKRWACKLLLPFSARKKAISAEGKRLQEEILNVRVALSHRTLVLYASLAVTFTSFSVVNIFTQSPMLGFERLVAKTAVAVAQSSTLSKADFPQYRM